MTDTLEEKQSSVLIVEDDPSISLALTEMLEDRKYKITQAHDGIQGLAEALRSHPDLIVLDILMPRLDGFTMLKSLRADEWGKHVPVVILTALSSAKEEVNAKIVELEPTYFLEKSSSGVDDVTDKIMSITESR